MSREPHLSNPSPSVAPPPSGEAHKPDPPPSSGQMPLPSEISPLEEKNESRPSKRRLLWGFLSVGFVLLVFLVALSYVFRDGLLRWWLTPGLPFEKTQAPAAPDYRKPEAWAAFPLRPSYAELGSVEPPPKAAAPAADVFYIHPTTYLSSASWNGPIDDKDAKRRIDGSVMKYQASAFNACCRIFAPRYRQASIAFAMSREKGGWQAMDRAFEDVVRAFRFFLQKNADRPFFLVGHSQGAMHGLRLLETFPDKKSHPSKKSRGDDGWRDRLVAAYLVGTSIPMRRFETSLTWLRPCSSPQDIRCIATWTTLGEKADPSMWDRLPVFSSHPKGYFPADEKGRLCVNPLLWKTTEETAPAALHKGGLPYAPADQRKAVEKALVSARCKKGSLLVSTPPSHFRRLTFRPHDYHVYDFSLFYQDIRLNTLQRLRSFQALSPTSQEAVPPAPPK